MNGSRVKFALCYCNEINVYTFVILFNLMPQIRTESFFIHFKLIKYRMFYDEFSLKERYAEFNLLNYIEGFHDPYLYYEGFAFFFLIEFNQCFSAVKQFRSSLHEALNTLLSLSRAKPS